MLEHLHRAGCLLGFACISSFFMLNWPSLLIEPLPCPPVENLLYWDFYKLDALLSPSQQ